MYIRTYYIPYVCVNIQIHAGCMTLLIILEGHNNVDSHCNSYDLRIIFHRLLL